MHRAFLPLVALALVLPATAGAATVTRECDFQDCALPPVIVTAPPGERNDIAFTRSAGHITVRDTGTPLVVGDGCVRLATDAVRCRAVFRDPAKAEEQRVLVKAGDGDDRISGEGLVPGGNVTVRFEGGDGDDVLSTGDFATRPQDPGNALLGGAGEDTLTGSARPDGLVGGPGNDILLGRGGDDFLAGDPGDEIGDDVIDGGEGSDLADYRDRTVAVDVDLADELPDGSAGEADRLIGVEDVVAAKAPGTLSGDAQDNELHAAGVGGRAIGHEGNDRLSGASVDGGPGDDDLLPSGAFECGDGVDRVFRRRKLAPLLPADCERAVLSGLVVDVAGIERVGRGVRMRVELTEHIRGAILLKAASRTIGRRHAPVAHAPRTVTVPLARGRRRVPPRLNVVYDPSSVGLPTQGVEVAVR